MALNGVGDNAPAIYAEEPAATKSAQNDTKSSKTVPAGERVPESGMTVYSGVPDYALVSHGAGKAGGGTPQGVGVMRLLCGDPLQAYQTIDITMRRNDGFEPVIVRQAQAGLAALGYDLGKSGRTRDGIDGVKGKITARAVADFQKEYMEPGTYRSGRLDQATIDAIQAASAEAVEELEDPAGASVAAGFPSGAEIEALPDDAKVRPVDFIPFNKDQVVERISSDYGLNREFVVIDDWSGMTGFFEAPPAYAQVQQRITSYAQWSVQMGKRSRRLEAALRQEWQLVVEGYGREVYRHEQAQSACMAELYMHESVPPKDIPGAFEVSGEELKAHYRTLARADALLAADAPSAELALAQDAALAEYEKMQESAVRYYEGRVAEKARQRMDADFDAGDTQRVLDFDRVLTRKINTERWLQRESPKMSVKLTQKDD